MTYKQNDASFCPNIIDANICGCLPLFEFIATIYIANIVILKARGLYDKIIIRHVLFVGFYISQNWRNVTSTNYYDKKQIQYFTFLSKQLFYLINTPIKYT